MNAIHVMVLFSMKNRELLEREKVMEQLSHFVRCTRRAPGCLLSALLKSTDDPMEFCFSQVWESKEALDAHLESAEFREFAPFIGKYMYSLAPRTMVEIASA